MSQYPELDSHITDKVKVVLELLSYATKNNKMILQSLAYLIYLLKEVLLL